MINEDFEDLNFNKKYDYFKSLLSNNNKALSLINNLENIILGHQPFDYDEVVQQCEQLIRIVYEITEDVNAVSRGKFEDLFTVAERIGITIFRKLMSKKRIDKTNWTISLANLSHENVSQVGNKAANLAEISNRANLPTPRGFSVTAYACHYFYKESGLYELIRGEMQGLDVKDAATLESTCVRVQKMITDAPLPMGVYNSIQNELKAITGVFGEDIRLAIRSSATGEDSQNATFAGQHTSILNVKPVDIIRAYKDVIASTFTPRAVFYRKRKGYRDMDVLMAVLCLMMIDARSSGCLYTINPNDPTNDDIFINANWGLGVSVVDGSMPTDYWQISRKGKQIVVEDIPVKKEMQVMNGAYDLSRVPVPVDRQNRPCLTSAEIKRLTEYGLKLETHFRHPLDVEWAVDHDGEVFVLQARSLKRAIHEMDQGDATSDDSDVQAHDILLREGMTAAPGTASGPAYILGAEIRLSEVPDGCILVTQQTSPDYVPAMSKIRGIITDVGSVTGHMASVAREFGIPTIVGTGSGTTTVVANQIITMDASRTTVYKGRIESLLNKKPPVNTMQGSPVYTLVRQTLKKIIPLHLVDPAADNFSPGGCRTLHDIVRFSHEMAMREMFRMGEEVKDQKDKYVAVKLKTHLPLNIYMLDLGGGVKVECGNESITANEISSIPFKALIRGMSHKDIRWSGASISADAGVTAPGSHMNDNSDSGEVTAKNDHTGRGPYYAIVSDEYVNFSVKLGDNFIMIDSFCSKQVNDNYIKLSFKGGAADVCRRERRAALVEGVLRKRGFKVEKKVDMLVAEMKKYDMQRTEENLDIIGRLLGSVHFLDVVLADDGQLTWYVDEFLRGNYVFKSN